jgi:hypothetical protein
VNEVELITAAREILSDPNRWHKGFLESFDGAKVCMLGALDRASGNYLLRSNPARVGVENLIEAHLPGGVSAWRGKDLVPIAAFNDDPATTHEDVLTLLDKTLADLGALGDA